MARLPLVSLPKGKDGFNRGAPFQILLEFQGGNAENKSGRSWKWWCLTYRGGSSIECNWGKRGNPGRKTPLDYEPRKAWKKVNEKLANGYRYAKGTTGTQIFGHLGKTPPHVLMPDRAVPSMQTSTPRPPPPSKLKGPFASIRKIRKIKDDLYRAFDGRGGFVLELNAEGADALVNADPFRVEMVS